MFDAKIKIISSVAPAILLSGCLASDGSHKPEGIAANSAVFTTPTVFVPGPGTPVTTPCAANTLCGGDSVTVTMPIDANGNATGAAATIGTVKFDAALATGLPVSATISGAVNTTVPVLTLVPLTGFIGTTADGRPFQMASASNGIPTVSPTLADPTPGLHYSNFGYWTMVPAAAVPGTLTLSAWAGGTQFTTTMPTTGSATYTGVTSGTSLVNATNTAYDLNGVVSLTANFATSNITGSITRITATNTNGLIPVAAGSFNNITLTGTINGNAFSGSAAAGAVPAGTNPASIAAGTAGTTAGHFYGPAANEVTGVWALSTGTVQALGSFGAKQ